VNESGILAGLAGAAVLLALLALWRRHRAGSWVLLLLIARRGPGALRPDGATDDEQPDTGDNATPGR
jgi:hypothetical protein